jgi:hypothetical protein
MDLSSKIRARHRGPAAQVSDTPGSLPLNPSFVPVWVVVA